MSEYVKHFIEPYMYVSHKIFKEISIHVKYSPLWASSNDTSINPKESLE